MDRSHEEFDDCYELISDKALGRGTFAFVFEAKPRTEDNENNVAVKIYITERGNPNLIVNEIESLKSLSHPNIIQLFSFFRTPQYVYLVFEKIIGGELLKHIIKINQQGVPYNEHLIRLKCKSILSALAHCHEHKVIHRDVKPENILMMSNSNDADIKLIDFGLSVKVSDYHYVRLL